ncbi:uncharacterized protein LOC112429801 isoform X2 [Maylandia zebra]
MVDKDFAEINALQKVFPESAILLCWYHVLQAVNRWLSKSESGVHGLSNTQKRNEIISFFCKLKACTSEDDFKATSAEFCQTFKQYPLVCQYFQKHWEGIGHMWCDYGRRFSHARSETNNVIERFFHRLKYQFLSGYKNRRLDDLIEVLLGKADDYLSVIKTLQDVGRMKNRFADTLSQVSDSASRLMESGWALKITVKNSHGVNAYQVPSESREDMVYDVCPVESYCNCTYGLRGLLCKHLVLLAKLAEADNDIYPNMETDISTLARIAVKERHYFVHCEDLKVIKMPSLFGNLCFFASAETLQCTCCTFSHYNTCACLKVACSHFKKMKNSLKSPLSTLNDTPVVESTDKKCTEDAVGKLNAVLDTVKQWAFIPEGITPMIDELHTNVLKTKQVGKSICQYEIKTTDNARKIRPLYSSKKRSASIDIPTVCENECERSITTERETSSGENENLLEYKTKKRRVKAKYMHK